MGCIDTYEHVVSSCSAGGKQCTHTTEMRPSLAVALFSRWRARHILVNAHAATASEADQRSPEVTLLRGSTVLNVDRSSGDYARL